MTPQVQGRGRQLVLCSRTKSARTQQLAEALQQWGPQPRLPQSTHMMANHCHLGCPMFGLRTMRSCATPCHTTRAHQSSLYTVKKVSYGKMIDAKVGEQDIFSSQVIITTMTLVADVSRHHNRRRGSLGAAPHAGPRPAARLAQPVRRGAQTSQLAEARQVVQSMAGASWWYCLYHQHQQLPGRGDQPPHCHPTAPTPPTTPRLAAHAERRAATEWAAEKEWASKLESACRKN